VTDLRDPLSDLVREVPRHVVPDDLHRTAWAAGRRRRWRRRALTAAAAAAVLAVLAPVLTPATDLIRSIEPADTRGGPTIGGFPQRIGHQWWVRDLPGRPGPLAGVMSRSVGEGTDDHHEIWLAVSKTGRQWRIPTEQTGGEIAPTISRTGRYLGYFPHRDGPPYVIHDLVTGETTELDQVEPHDNPLGRYMVHWQTPGFWSPDDRHLLLFGITPRPGAHLVLSTDGSARQVRPDGVPAGWVDADHPAWLSSTERRDRTVDVTITVTDLEGRSVRTVDLALPRPLEGRLSQWSAVVSPDGRSVALLEESWPDETIHQFSLTDGSPTAEPATVSDMAAICPLGWAGSTPLVSTYPEHTSGRLAALVHPPVETMVASDPGLGVTCLALASDAAAGEAHGWPLGTRSGLWTWWWREILLGVALAGALRWLWLRRRKRLEAARDWRSLRPLAEQPDNDVRLG
jgi:hypothetical protein